MACRKEGDRDRRLHADPRAYSLRVTAYGTSDELNSFVGVARLVADGNLDEALSLIQNDLFDLGADLCRPDMEQDAEAEYPPLRMTEAQVTRLETEIDAMNANLDPMRSFILPGGSPLAAHVPRGRNLAADQLCSDGAGIGEMPGHTWGKEIAK